MSLSDFCIAANYLTNKLQEPEFMNIFEPYAKLTKYLEAVLTNVKENSKIKESLP